MFKSDIKSTTNGQFEASLLTAERVIVPQHPLTSATAITIDLSTFSRYSLLLQHNVSLTFIGLTPGGGCAIAIRQSSGGHTLTLPNICYFPENADKVLSTAAGALDLLGIEVWSDPTNLGSTILFCNLLKSWAI